MANAPPKLSFFTNHAHVLVLLLRRNGAPLRVISQELGITERSVQGIVSDLERIGIVVREKIGRTNSYSINTKERLVNSREQHRTIRELLEFLGTGEVSTVTDTSTPEGRKDAINQPQGKLLVYVR